MTDSLQNAFVDWARNDLGLELTDGIHAAMGTLVTFARAIESVRGELGDPGEIKNQTPQARDRFTQLEDATVLFAEMFHSLTGRNATRRYIDPNGGDEPIPLPAPNSRRLPEYIALSAESLTSSDNDDAGVRFTQQVRELDKALHPFRIAWNQFLPPDQSRQNMRELLDLQTPSGAQQSPAHKLFDDLQTIVMNSTALVVGAQEEIAERRMGTLLWRDLGFALPGAPGDLESAERMQALGREFMTRASALAQAYSRGAIPFSDESLWQEIRVELLRVRDPRGLPLDELTDDAEVMSLRDDASDPPFNVATEGDIEEVLEQLDIRLGEGTEKSDLAIQHLGEAGRLWRLEQQRIERLSDDLDAFETALDGAQRLTALRRTMIDLISTFAKGIDQQVTIDERFLPDRSAEFDTGMSLPEGHFEDAITAMRGLRMDNLQGLVVGVRDFRRATDDALRRYLTEFRAAVVTEWGHMPVGLPDGGWVPLGEFASSPANSFNTEVLDAYRTTLDVVQQHVVNATIFMQSHFRDVMNAKVRGALIENGIIGAHVTLEQMETLLGFIASAPEVDDAGFEAHVLRTSLEKAGVDLDERAHEGIKRFAWTESQPVLDVLILEATDTMPNPAMVGSVSESWSAIGRAIEALDALREEVQSLDDPESPSSQRKVEELAQCTHDLRDVLHVAFRGLDGTFRRPAIDMILPAVDVDVPQNRAMAGGLIAEPDVPLSPDTGSPGELPGHAAAVVAAVEDVHQREVPGDAHDAVRRTKEAAVSVAEVSRQQMHLSVSRHLGRDSVEDGRVAVDVMLRALRDDDRGYRPRSAKRAVLLAACALHHQQANEDFRAFQSGELMQAILTLPGEPVDFDESQIGIATSTRAHRFELSEGERRWTTQYVNDDPSAHEHADSLARLDRAAFWLQSETERFERMKRRNRDDPKATAGMREVQVLNQQCAETLRLALGQGEAPSVAFSPPLGSVEELATYVREWDRPHAELRRAALAQMTAIVEEPQHGGQVDPSADPEHVLEHSAHTTTLEYVGYEVARARQRIVDDNRRPVFEWLGDAILHHRELDLGSPLRGAQAVNVNIGRAFYEGLVEGKDAEAALFEAVSEAQLVDVEGVPAPVEQLMHDLRSTPPSLSGPDLEGPDDSPSRGGGPTRPGPSGPTAGGEARELPKTDDRMPTELEAFVDEPRLDVEDPTDTQSELSMFDDLEVVSGIRTRDAEQPELESGLDTDILEEQGARLQHGETPLRLASAELRIGRGRGSGRGGIG